MAMKQCRECGQQVSTDANSCPHCGKTNPTGSFAGMGCAGKGCILLVGFVVAVMVIGSLGSNFDDSSSDYTSQTSTSSGRTSGDLYGDLHTTCDGYPITTSQAHLDRLVEFAASDDKEAWVRYIRENPGVQMLDGGQQVYVEDTEDLGGVVKIRPKGETAGVWTVREAIQQPCR